MNFWEQFLLNQASAGLQAIIIKYASKYFSTEEQQACSLVVNALISLPQRVHTGTTNTNVPEGRLPNT